MHGSPCQDFSLAGKQAGGDKDSGTRSSLMYETIRIVEKLKPKYVIWENVKNLLSKKHRHNFDAYLEKMEQLGYTNYYQVLNAKDYGIPQNRERVFTVSILKESIVYDDYNSNIRKDQDTIGTLTTNCGSGTIRNGWKIIEHKQHFEFPKGEECENKIQVVGNYMPSGHDASRIVDENGLAPTVKENHGTVTAVLQRFEFPSKQELKLKLKDMLEDEVDEKYYLSDKTLQNYTRNFGSKGKMQNEESFCETLQAAMGTGGGNVPIVSRKYGVFDTKKSKHQAGSGGNDRGVVVNEPMIYDDRDKGWGIKITDICPTQRAMRTGIKCIYPNLRIRKLTPKECWRLMGFDDEDFEKASKVNSNTQLYKQAGNSIVVNVLEEILRRLLL